MPSMASLSMSWVSKMEKATVLSDSSILSHIQLFWRGMFDFPKQADHTPTSLPMCKTEHCRRQCLNLLYELGTGSVALFAELARWILLQHETMGMSAISIVACLFRLAFVLGICLCLPQRCEVQKYM